MQPKSVTTITPLRMSLAGGGTDFPEYYLHNGGAVLSTAIDKYIYVNVKTHNPLFNERYRLNYSITEHVNSIDQIENQIARECLRLVNIDSPLSISTSSDIPSGTGLGSSSSFAVGLLNCLHYMKNETVSPVQLAEEACHVELEMLNKPIGKQDQYAAAFGGLNFIEFQKSGRVMIDHLWSQRLNLEEVFSNLLLLWTGTQRSAESILKHQKAVIEETKGSLDNIKYMAFNLRDSIINNSFDVELLGKYLDQGWQEKKSLTTQITNEKIDNAYAKAIQSGALGGKLLGAGGGGFLLLTIPKNKKTAIEKNLPGLYPLSVNFEPLGSRILSIVA